MRFQIGWLPPVEKSRAPLTDIHVFSTTRPVWLMNVTCQSVGLPWLSNTHTNEQQTARLCPQKFAKTSPTVRQQRRAAAAAAFTFHLPPDLLINKSCGSIWLMSLTSELISRQRRRRWLFHIKIPASNGKFFGEIHYVMRCVHYGDGGNRMRVVCIYDESQFGVRRRCRARQLKTVVVVEERGDYSDHFLLGTTKCGNWATTWQRRNPSSALVHLPRKDFFHCRCWSSDDIGYTRPQQLDWREMNAQIDRLLGLPHRTSFWRNCWESQWDQTRQADVFCSAVRWRDENVPAVYRINWSLRTGSYNIFGAELLLDCALFLTIWTIQRSLCDVPTEELNEPFLLCLFFYSRPKFTFVFFFPLLVSAHALWFLPPFFSSSSFPNFIAFASHQLLLLLSHFSFLPGSVAFQK